MKENIELAIGIVIAAALMLSYYKISGSKNKIMLKQELVAQRYKKTTKTHSLHYVHQ